jgi:polyhydroxyalkanoate synthesis regulator phasin
MNRKTQITTIELADLSGKTAKTVQNWANKGKLSYERDENGGFLFELSDIARVFPKIDLSGVISRAEGEIPAKSGVIEHKITPRLREGTETVRVSVENEFLKEKVDDLKAQVSELKDEKEVFASERKNYLDIIQKQNNQMTGLLPAPDNLKSRSKPNILLWLAVGIGSIILILLLFSIFNPAIATEIAAFF